MSPLAALLLKEQTLVRQFNALLLQEQHALTQRDIDSLSSLSEQKLVLVNELNQLETQRNALIGQGLDVEPSTAKALMTQWLTKHREDRDSATLWQSILKMAEEARRTHQLNAELLSTQLQQTGEALSVLLKHQRNVSLYGSDGHTATDTGSRIVDSA